MQNARHVQSASASQPAAGSEAWQMRGVPCAARACPFGDESVERSQSLPVRPLCERAMPPRLVVAAERAHVRVRAVVPSQHVGTELLAAAPLRIRGMRVLCCSAMQDTLNH